MKKKRLLFMLFAFLAFGPTAWAQLTGSGTSESPYLIANESDWNTLATNVNDGTTTYSGKYFKLMDNISVTNMVGDDGSHDRCFSGIFDGNGKTITFNLANATEQYIAPFRRINKATVKNLKVTGTVSSSNRFAGGIVAYAKGTSTVTDCMNSTSITCVNKSGASNGGIVGMVGGSGTINITGCVFNGQMSGTSSTDWCGILGLCNNNCTANISNCLFDPASAEVNGYTLYRNNNETTSHTNISNCYYTQSMTNNQGKQADTITGGENVTVENAGTVTSEATIGVTGYSTGIKYNNVLYAGGGDEVSLSLTVPMGMVINSATYTPVGGSAEAMTHETGNVYSFTMPNANVTITATIGFPLVISAGGWHAISSPMHNSGNDETVVDVTNLTDASYDLFGYDETAATWRNQKSDDNASGFNTLIRGHGYIYRRSTAETLIFTGEPNTGDVSYILSNTAAQGELAGWHLVGNPYPQSISTSTPYYSLSADGAWVLGNGTIAAGQAVLVYTANDNATITFSTTESYGMVIPGNKGSIPAVPKGLSLGDGCDDSDNQAIAQSHKQDFAHLNGDQLLITLPGHLEAYDMMGRCLFGRQLNSFPTTLPTTLFPGTGVYVLRLDGKSQKIVVR